MTLTFKHDLYPVNLNQLAKYLGQRSFSSEVFVHTHNEPIALSGPLERSINICLFISPQAV